MATGLTYRSSRSRQGIADPLAAYHVTSVIVFRREAILNNSHYSSVAERQSCKLKVLGSIPSGGLIHAGMQAMRIEHLRVWEINTWPVGLMDEASASGAGDSRFESWAGHPCPAFGPSRWFS